MRYVLLACVVGVGALIALVPSMSRPTVPLGVSVPRERITDPAVRRALGRFRLGVGALTVAGLVAGLLGDPSIVFGPAILGVVVRSIVVIAVARRGIVAAKQQGQWYAGQPVRTSASVSGPTGNPRPAWILYAVAALMAVAAPLWLLVRFDRLPDPYPRHWSVSGPPDGWGARNLLAVLLPSGWPILLIALFAAMMLAVSRRRAVAPPDGSPLAARAARRAVYAVVRKGVGCIAIVIGAASLASAIVIGADRLSAPPVIVWVEVAALAVVVTWLVVGARRAQSQSAAAPATGAQSHDDDADWKLGMFYYRPDDPSFLVPKRVGVGETINFGHPAGKISAVVILIMLVAAIVASALSL